MSFLFVFRVHYLYTYHLSQSMPTRSNPIMSWTFYAGLVYGILHKCGNASAMPLGGKDTRGHILLNSCTVGLQIHRFVKILTPAGQMVNNCCVVGCTNYVDKKKGLSFYRFPVPNKRDLRDGCIVAVRRKTGNLNHIHKSAMNILYQVMNCAYMVVANGHADRVLSEQIF